MECSFNISRIACDSSRKNFSEFSRDDQDLLITRSNLNKSENQFLTICDTHKKTLLDFYEKNQRKYADPFESHDSNITTSLRSVTTETAMKFKKLFPEKQLFAGQKLCTNCRKKVLNDVEVLNTSFFCNFVSHLFL